MCSKNVRRVLRRHESLQFFCLPLFFHIIIFFVLVLEFPAQQQLQILSQYHISYLKDADIS
jgi:hypothetical protein